jgi:hypothetical protein
MQNSFASDMIEVLIVTWLLKLRYYSLLIDALVRYLHPLAAIRFRPGSHRGTETEAGEVAPVGCLEVDQSLTCNSIVIYSGE